MKAQGMSQMAMLGQPVGERLQLGPATRPLLLLMMSGKKGSSLFHMGSWSSSLPAIR